jgi:nucleoside-diphosphate-sugar epimerase
MPTTVAVTGSSGFLGAALVARFESMGVRTIGLDLADPAAGCAPSQFYRGDIRDTRWCEKTAAGCDVVIHAAAAVPLTKDRAMHEINVTGARNIAAAARGAAAFIHISSSAVYGVPATLPVRTTAPLRPVERYGRSKLLAEHAVRDALGDATRLTVLRPRTVVAPSRGGLFSFLFDAIHAGTALPVFGADTVIQFVHLDDVVDAVVTAAAPSFTTGVVNLGAPDPRPLAIHLAELVAHANSDAAVWVLPPRLASWAAGALCATNVLPFAPWHTKTYGRSFVVDLEELRASGIEPKFSNHATLLDAFDRHRVLDGASPHTAALSSALLSQTLRLVRKVCR